MSDAQGNARFSAAIPPSRLKPPTTHGILGTGMQRAHFESNEVVVPHISDVESKERISLSERAALYNKSSIPGFSYPSKTKDAPLLEPKISSYAQSRPIKHESITAHKRNVASARPATATGTRLKSRMPGMSQSVSGRPGTSMAHKRTASRMDGYSNDGGDGKRNGTARDSIPSFCSSSNLRLRKARDSQSMVDTLQSLSDENDSSRNVSGSTDASVTRAMARLNLGDIKELPESRTSSYSSVDLKSILPSSNGSSISRKPWDHYTSNNAICKLPKTLRKDIRRSGMFQDPKFHSLLPTIHTPGPPNSHFEEPLVEAPRTKSKSPQKAPPKLPLFLNKESNVPILTAFDIEDKEEMFGQMWSKMKGDMNDTMQHQTQLQEQIALFKSKGMYISGLHFSLFPFWR